MTEREDWSALGETWRAGPPADVVSGLLAKVQRKRRLMALMVSLEVGLTMLATVLVVKSALLPSTRAWSLTVLAVIWIMQAVLLYLRRGQWRAPTLQMEDLLRLMARRARTGILLVWVNVAGLVALALVSVPFAVRWWRGSPDLSRLPAVIIVNTVAMAVTVAISVWFVRRQRRTLRRVDELLAELTQ